MQLKTKLVAAATVLTFAIVVILSTLFMSELMRQRIEQTEASNNVLAHQVYLMMRAGAGGRVACESSGGQER